MPVQSSSELWKNLTPEQRQQAIERMTPEQKMNLASSLGYKDGVTPTGETKGGLPVYQGTPDEDPGIIMGGLGELFNAGKGLVTTSLTPPQNAREWLSMAYGGPPAVATMRGAQGELESRGTALQQAGQQFKTAGSVKGDPLIKFLDYMRSGVTGATGLIPVPGVASMSTGINRAVDAGHLDEATGKAGVDALMLALGLKKGLGSETARQSPIDPLVTRQGLKFEPREIDPVSGMERIARKKIVPGFRPVNTDALSRMVKILRNPTILRDIGKFAAQDKNPMGDLLQVSDAAKSAGRYTTGYYRQHIIDPNWDVKLPGMDMTVGEGYMRASKINDMLSPKYLKGESQLSATLDSEKAIELKTELNRINNAMYETLSERTGLPPEQVQSINQRGAQLQDLGKQLEVSHNTLQQGGIGVDEAGKLIPRPYHPFFDTIVKMVNTFRGGEMGIAAKGVRKATSYFPEGYEPLPDPETIHAYRRGVERGDLGETHSEKDFTAANLAERRARLARDREGITPGQGDFLKPEVVSPEAGIRDFLNRQRERQGVRATNAERVQEALRRQSEREAANKAARSSRKEGLGPTQPPGPPVEVNPEPELQARSERASARSSRLAEAQRRTQEILRQRKLKEQERLAKAAEIQKQAKVVRDY